MTTTNLARKGAGSSKGSYLDKTDNPSIYVACLAAYNNGKYHGRWIDCTLGESHIEEEIQNILKTSPESTDECPCEEWAIHDYEYFPSGLIREYMGIEQVVKLAEILEKPDGEAILQLHCYLGSNDLDDTLEHHENNFCGSWDSFSDYVYDYVESTGMLGEAPDFISNYFDYEAFGRDLEMDMIVIRENGETHVWHN